MPDLERLLKTLDQAAQAFWRTPGRVGRWIRLPPGVEVFAVGDLHGNVENFRRILQRADLARHPARHLVLQEAIHGPYRYPGGGDKSHQMLDLTAALKCQFPERVHYLLGNHELAQWQNQRIGKGDIDQNAVFRAGVEEAYGAGADRVLEAYGKLFESFDLALRTANRIWLSHSFPARPHLSSFSFANLEKITVELNEVRWGGYLHSLVWGRDVSPEAAGEFLRLAEADLLITGHIPSPRGFEVPNDRHLILDSLGSPAGYCLFPTDGPLTQQELLARVEML